MHCDDFLARLNDVLDLREDPADDLLLAQHAERCGECSQVLRQWGRLGHALAPTTAPMTAMGGGPVETHRPSVATRPDAQNLARSPLPRPVRTAPSLVAAAALAVAVLGGVWFSRAPVDRQSPTVAEATRPGRPQLDFEQIEARVGQPEWWGSMVRAAWEPVDPLAEGFRPLTNSFQTAFELLTPRVRSATTLPAPLPEESKVSLAASAAAVV